MDELVRGVLVAICCTYLSWSMFARAVRLRGLASAPFGLTMLSMSFGAAVWLLEWLPQWKVPSWSITFLVAGTAARACVLGRKHRTANSVEEIEYPWMRLIGVAALLITIALSIQTLQNIPNPFIPLPAITFHSARIENVRQGEHPILELDATVNRLCDAESRVVLREHANLYEPRGLDEAIYVHNSGRVGYIPPHPRKVYRIPLSGLMNLPTGLASGVYKRWVYCPGEEPDGKNSPSVVMIIPPFYVLPPIEQ